MHPNVHFSTVYNSQDIDATYMSMDRGMDKEDMVQIYNGIVLSLLFIQNKEIMPFAATRMDLVSVILSEVSQTKRNIV